MKKVLLFAAIMLISTVCFAQDIISTKRGQRVQAIVTEITPTLVRYKLFSNPQGKAYFMYKDDVSGIMYQNGKVETFDHPEARAVENNSNENQPRQVNPPVVKQESDEIQNQSIDNSNQRSDLIQFRNGTSKRVSILEITPSIIRYRNYDNPNGAIHSINKSEVAKIIYQNGQEDVFDSQVNSNQQNNYQETTNQSIENSYQETNLVVGISPIRLWNGLRVKLEKPKNNKFTYGGILTYYYDHTFPGIQIAPIARFYFKKHAPEGFYAQAKLPVSYFFNADTPVSFGLGVALGNQILWGKDDRWSLDLNFGFKFITPSFKSTGDLGDIVNLGGYYLTGPGSFIDGLISIGYRF